MLELYNPDLQQSQQQSLYRCKTLKLPLSPQRIKTFPFRVNYQKQLITQCRPTNRCFLVLQVTHLQGISHTHRALPVEPLCLPERQTLLPDPWVVSDPC